MANSGSHSAKLARIRRAGAVAAALMLGVTGLAAIGSAQQPKKTPEKAPTAAAKKGAPQAEAAGEGEWVKLCEGLSRAGKDKDGKEVKDTINICMTLHQRLHPISGFPVIFAAMRQIEGQGDKQSLVVRIPPEVALKPGLRATFVPVDLWEAALKGDKVDEKKLTEFRLDFAVCEPVGCTADVQVTTELMSQFKSAGGFMVTFISPFGQRALIPVPLKGFEQARAGPATDSKAYEDAHKQLVMQIDRHRQELAEEYKKKQEEQQKKGPAVAKDAPAAKTTPSTPAKK